MTGNTYFKSMYDTCCEWQKVQSAHEATKEDTIQKFGWDSDEVKAVKQAVISFGGSLNNEEMFVAYYHEEIKREFNNFVSTAKALETERDVIIVCSNVLNVLTDADLAKVLGQLKKLRENFRAKAIYITVYEGDRTGIGRQTGPDQWQRNEQLGEYAARFVDMGMRVAIHRGILRVMAKEA